MLEIGQEAPLFALPNQQGEMRLLKDYQGQYVVLYFYPEDNTPGCTQQACSYRDTMPEFTKRKIKVFGISKDGGESHRQFEKDFDLNFELLSDEDMKTINAYEVWGEKIKNDVPYMGVIRTTFVVDPNGKIIKVFPKVDPKLDSQQVLEFIDQH